MAISMKVDPIRRDIELFFEEAMGPQARSRMLADEGRKQLAAAKEVNRRAIGNVPNYETYVDGLKGGTEDAVKPEGTIVYEFNLIEEVIDWIQEQLLLHSPIRSGRYRRSHVLFADGEEVQFGAVIPPAQRYVFVNSQPYARRIERGWSSQAPEGVFETVADLAQRKSNLATIRFGFESLVGGGTDLEDWAQGTGQTRMGTRRAVAEWNRRQPAIIVTIK